MQSTAGTRIFFLPGGFTDPQAPTLAELNAGIELTEYVTAIRFAGPHGGRRVMHSTYHLKARRRTSRRLRRRR